MSALYKDVRQVPGVPQMESMTKDEDDDDEKLSKLLPLLVLPKAPKNRNPRDPRAKERTREFETKVLQVRVSTIQLLNFLKDWIESEDKQVNDSIRVLHGAMKFGMEYLDR